jgi:pyruvate kinase
MGIPALTKKDKSDVKVCVGQDLDYIALSFVRKPSDVVGLRKYLSSLGSDIPIISKIEKPEALDKIEQIIEASDGIMVARGDLGVELPPEKVPVIQNQLIQMANEYNKPVIVATQMLESMIGSSRPTRAEATDVSSACINGADAVMLSAETAAGRYPLEAVKMMDIILRETETNIFFAQGGFFRKYEEMTSDILHNAIGNAIAQLSRDLMVRTVFVITRTGYSARIVASDRPSSPIFAFTPSQNIQRRLNLVWGIYPYYLPENNTMKDYIAYGEGILRELKLAGPGNFTIVLSSADGPFEENHSIYIHKLR